MSRAIATPRLLLGLAATLIVLLVCSGVAEGAVTYPYTGTYFGPEGVETGSFLSVTSVAVQESTGDVFVLDRNGKLYKFDAGGEPVNFSSTGTNVIEKLGYNTGGYVQIAVDDSSGPAAGDIYIAKSGTVKIYSEAGESIGTLTGSGACGVAVDTAGNVYVADGKEGIIRRYLPAANPVTNADEHGFLGGVGSVCNIAVDSAGDVYAANGGGGSASEYGPGQIGSLMASGEAIPAPVRATIAADPTSTEAFIDEGTAISQYDGAAKPPSFAGSTGKGLLSSSDGVAVDGAAGMLYAGDGSAVEIFGPKAVVAGATTEKATSVEDTEVTLNATIEPSGTEVTSCEFEYGTKAGELTESAPCEPVTPYTGPAQAVTARLSGLTPATTYHYQVTAAGASGSQSGSEETVHTTGPPALSGEYFHDVSATTATVQATLAPNGEDTSYLAEYGTSTEYGASTSPTSAGGGDGTLSISVTLTELEPETTYHVRLVAKNASGSFTGTDLTLTAGDLAPASLPDGRGWELVTSLEDDGNGEAYAPAGSGWSVAEEYTVYSQYPVAPAANGDALAYVAGPTAEGNGKQGMGEGNEFIARRTAAGEWTQAEMQPFGYRFPYFIGFSANLEHAVMESTEPINGQGPPNPYDGLYEWSESGITPLFSMQPPNRSESGFGFALTEEGYATYLKEGYAGGSADGTHQLFTANDALNSEAGDPSEEMNNLYDSVNGEPKSVNVLPNGTPAPNATFGAPSEWQGGLGETGPDYSHVISTDGSRVFWTDLNTGSLYVRENDATTSLIAEEAKYLTASADGSKVLYTNEEGELYEYDQASETTEELEPAPELVGIMGASEDLSYIYFVARAELAPGAEVGKENLYVLHGGETRYIATLGTAREESEKGAYLETEKWQVLPWSQDIGMRTADVTPSGQGLMFLSKSSLTGYNNKRLGASFNVAEVYVYDAENGALSCASCLTSGAQPTSGAFFPISEEHNYQLNVMSEDGGQVFFASNASLVPQATNSPAANVYEWERNGSGSCHHANGCIYLISTGSSETGSYLIGVSASGEDVFVMTRSPLLSQDENEYNDIYDAHVGAVPPPEASRCTGTGCQGVPATPPVFATPASSTYNGVGNFTPPPAKAHNKEQSTKQSSARKRKLRRALKRCVKTYRHNRHKRQACKRRARRRYGAKAARHHRAARHRHGGRGHHSHAAKNRHHNGRGK